MNIIRTVSVAVAIIWQTFTYAETVSSTAGRLSELLVDPAVTELSIEGTLDASDFDYINTNLRQLKKLDFSRARIEAYSGARVLTGLTKYNADELPAYSLAGMEIEDVVLPHGLRSVGEGAFSTSKIASIVLPETVYKIEDYAFAGCGQLKSIAVSRSVSTIGTGAFTGCSNLESVDFSKNAAEIGARVFDGCGALKSVVLPEGLTLIGENAFRGTMSLTELSFPTSLQSIGEGAFYGSGLVSADLSECRKLRSIGNFAFAECGDLVSVKFGGVPQLGAGVFFDDAALSDFVLPESITVIPEFTFKGDTSLRSAGVLHEGVAEIGDYALTGWIQVAELSLPASLRHIGDNAMEGMTGLTEITATGIDAVPTLGADVWKNVEQADVILYVDEARAESYRSADQWNRFKVTVKGSDSVDPIVSDAADSGIEYKFNDNKLVISSKGAAITSVEVYDLAGGCRYSRSASAQVVSIDASVFGKTSVVVSITLADGSHNAVKATF